MVQRWEVRVKGLGLGAAVGVGDERVRAMRAQSMEVIAAECAVSAGGGAVCRRVGSRSNVTSPAALPTW